MAERLGETARTIVPRITSDEYSLVLAKNAIDLAMRGIDWGFVSPVRTVVESASAGLDVMTGVVDGVATKGFEAVDTVLGGLHARAVELNLTRFK